MLPDAVGSALRDGLREEAAPISRRLAEVKGLSNQMVRRIERLETDLLAERHARVDDLALLVELITGQWRAMNERLDRIERLARPPRGTSFVPLDRPGRHGLDPARLTAGYAAGRQSARTASRGRPRSRARSGPPSAVESSLAIVSPSPVPPPPETNGRNSRSRCSGGIPGPVSSTATLDLPFVCAELELDPAAVGRRAERVREQVVDDLEHAVAVGDDHRAGADVDAVVDRPRAAPRSLNVSYACSTSCSMSTSSRRTVKRCASSFARSRMSPTRRSSRVRLRLDDLERPRPLLGILDDALEQRRDVAADRGQRRPQLVRDRHQEVALARLRLRRAASVISSNRSARWPISPGAALRASRPS